MTEEQLTARDALYQRVAKLIGYPGTWFNPSASPHCEVAMLNYIQGRNLRLTIQPSPGGALCRIDEDDGGGTGMWWRTHAEIVRPTRPEAIARAIESMGAGNG